MATYLTRTPASTTDAQRKTWTYSVWVKPSNIVASGNGGEFAYIYQYSGGSSAYVRMDSNYKLRFRDYTNGGSPDYLKITDRLFRDPSAWYHVVLRHDTTQSTAADRVRLYVNGELQEWQNANYPAQDHVGFINSTFPAQIGETSSNVLRGSYLSQAIMCAGQSYAPTVFGSTNANGIWVPNSSPSVTYGTNGFKLDFIGTGASADASGFGADSSGNNNHFASTGLGTNPSTSDNPYNNFATMNPLIGTQSQTPTYSKGNTIVTSTSNGSYGASALSTFAIDSGKWYWETKLTGDRNNGIAIGLADATWAVGSVTDSWFGGSNLNGYAFQYSNSGQKKVDDGTGTSYGSQIQVNDILGTAYDADNNTITWYINGSSQGQAFSSMRNITFVPASYGYYNTQWEFNFGNPAFTIASGNSDANGYGNFEYAVPSGYYALCTKNLAAYGG